MIIDFSDKFWSRVAIGNKNECWEWQTYLNNSGYGIYWRNGTPYIASRVAAFLVGMIPSLRAPKRKSAKGFVLHKCDNRKCCNPYHLFIGNFSDNTKDAYSKGRKKLPQGETNPNSKLTNKQAAYIRKLYSTGKYTQLQLADRYNMARTNISLLLRNKTYQ